eukprot:4738694-Prymnesium_polylepis.1
MRKLAAARALAPHRGTHEYAALGVWGLDWNYDDCRDVVLSWLDTAPQRGRTLSRLARSARYEEAHGAWLGEQLMRAVLCDGRTGARYAVAELEEGVRHVLRVMVWMEGGIFERDVAFAAEPAAGPADDDDALHGFSATRFSAPTPQPLSER